MPSLVVAAVLALLASAGAEVPLCRDCQHSQGENLLLQLRPGLRAGGHCKVWRDLAALKALIGNDPELHSIEQEVSTHKSAFCNATQAVAAEKQQPREGAASLLAEKAPLAQALQAMWDDMEGVKRDAESATALANSLLAAAVANISTCAGTLNATKQAQLGPLEVGAEAGRGGHATCRSAEAELKLAMDGEYQDFHAYWTALALPDCTSNFPQANWDDAWACLSGLDSWTTAEKVNVSARHDSWLAAIHARGNKTEECNAKQLAFEAAICTWVAGYEVACSAYAACYASTVAAHAQLRTNMQQAERARKADYASAERVQCHLRVMNATEPAEKERLLAECATAQQPDTSHLSMTYPAVPAEEACYAADEPRPCQPGWLQAAYADQPWHAEAPAQACSPCQAAEAFAWAGREFAGGLSDFEDFTARESGTNFGPELSLGFTARIDKVNDWTLLDFQAGPEAAGGNRANLWIGCGSHGQNDFHVVTAYGEKATRQIANIVTLGSTDKFLVTLARDGQTKIYKDGELKYSGHAPEWEAVPGPVRPSRMFLVGKHDHWTNDHATGGHHPIRGLIQDFRIWNRVLTWQEFTAPMPAPAPLPTLAPTPLPTTAPTPMPAPAALRPALTWAGREFTGDWDSEDLLPQASSTDFGLDLSVGFTARFDKAGGWTVLDLRGDSSEVEGRENPSLWIYSNPDQKTFRVSLIYKNSDDVPHENLLHSDLVSVGATSRFLVTLASDGQVKIHKDGQLRASGSFEGWAALPGPFRPLRLMVGRIANHYPMDGIIRDLGIWNSVLTWQEFEALA